MDLGREALKQCPLSTHELVHIYDGESVRLNSNSDNFKIHEYICEMQVKADHCHVFKHL